MFRCIACTPCRLCVACRGVRAPAGVGDGPGGPRGLLLHAFRALVGDRIYDSLHCGRSILAVRGSRGLGGPVEMGDGPGALGGALEAMH